ncbi:hypothetical protein [Sphaerotilus microaerophilus]|uniref:Uncharacterized protein n=1 Tax=Sphaerotilus microaerophilus TaxID=2914710 RepID=A0ABN6PM21_9BURK|nr:hypothetical protein [Sphaerotilus sp. FB-5]BDI05282.1 hypothetical protein CATMQ487_22520 [Sphaerotilus sp. FB-5]
MSSGVMSKGAWALMVGLAGGLAASQAAAHDGDLDKTNPYQARVLAKAQPDECFGGVGATYEPYAAPGCTAPRVPKVNQAYVWGLAKTDTHLWIGTAPNVNCLVEGTYLSLTTPYQTASWACEFGSSGYRAMYAPALPAALGDWRPSRIHRHSLKDGSLADLGATMDVAGRQRLAATLGLRSAGTHRGVVILAGPAINQQGLNLFAFNAKTSAFLGSYTLPGYRNIRKWTVAGDELYTTAGRVNGSGAVIRWTGSVATPFQFVEVGTLPSEGAELTAHDGRLFVATWPNVDPLNPAWAGVFRSALLPRKGGLPASTGAFTQVWDVRQYEPDPVVALTYGGGAIASYQGKLVWGTMHVPGVATAAHLTANAAYYAGLDPAERTVRQIVAALLTQRAVALFSQDAVRTTLLYGSARLPAFNAVTKQWQLLPNAAGLTPQLGGSGFDNPFNNYTWTMATTKKSLFVGTMDWSYLLRSRLESLLPGLTSLTPTQWTDLRARLSAMPEVQGFLADHPGLLDTAAAVTGAAAPVPAGPVDDRLANGADLMRFDRLDRKAVAVSRSGVGNFLNYGLRTMIASEGRLYIGSANPMNLETAQGDGRPDGGWELLELRLGDRGH